MRTSCAWGGSELPKGRAEMSDEEWVDLGRPEADGDYYAGFKQRFGLDLE